MSEKNKNQISALKRRMASMDLSDQSEIKDSLRQELLQRIAAERRETTSNNRFFRRLDMFFKPVSAMALGIFLGVTILAIGHPDTRASIANFVKSFRVGDNTYVVQSGTLGETELDAVLAELDEKLERGRSYILRNEYGGWGGAVPEGGEPVIRQLSSLSITARLVDHPLQVPTYYNEKIPARYRFRNAQILPDGGTILCFGIGRWETMLKQSPVGNDRSVVHQNVIMTTESDGTQMMSGVEPQIEEIEIGGIKVFWQIHDKGTRHNLGKWSEQYPDKVIGQFIWENDGMRYVLDGKLLTRDEGLKIIESLRPTPVKN
jgi:hypothetical protein